MEQQLTIFDVFNEMDHVEDKEMSLYEKCAIPGLVYEDLKGNIKERHKGMNYKMVVLEKPRKRLFLMSIEEHMERPKNKISFYYEAINGYWGGNYGTDDSDMIKGSIARLSKDIIKEEEAE